MRGMRAVCVVGLAVAWGCSASTEPADAGDAAQAADAVTAADLGARSDAARDLGGPEEASAPDGTPGAPDAGPPPDLGESDARATDAGEADAGPTPVPDAGPSTEVCNGLDDDQDGAIDDGLDLACGTAIGACRMGVRRCVNGVYGSTCEGEIAATAERCNSLDDDCDGTVDDGLGLGAACDSTDADACTDDVRACGAAGAVVCMDQGAARPELCNAMDDDCDGVTDEGLGVGTACDSTDADSCTDDVRACGAAGAVVCTDRGAARPELCNGTDDDCDGMTDEGCTCTNGQTQPCGSAVGRCRAGTQTCAAGAWGACTGGVGPVTETCNAVDDDCNGMTDDAIAPVTCGTGACQRTVMCTSGMQVCTPGPVAAETCNGTDDDCNGAVDDGIAPITCGVGACRVMVPGCTAGMPTACTPGMAGTETCNGLDDDCDGTPDDGLGTITCGVGACRRTVPACAGGLPGQCTPLPGMAETCNGLDDDCDGTPDDGLAMVETRVGQCVERTSCVGGVPSSIGTFVGTGGTVAGPGTRAQRLNSLAAAIANAQTIGGGADVCVCANGTAPGATFTSQDANMVEGVSVIGGFSCATWDPATRDLAAYNTYVSTSDADGLLFPAGITAATVLDSMWVIGAQGSATLSSGAAITVLDSSPTLVDVRGAGGMIGSSYGLQVRRSGAAPVTPLITRGRYSARGLGDARAISIEGGASPRLVDATAIIDYGTAIGTPRNAWGIDCVSCAGTQVMGGTVDAGSATTTGTGVSIRGMADGVVLTNVTVIGGNAPTSIGVQLESCVGAPMLVNGASILGSAPFSTSGVHTGVQVSGAMCAPLITGAAGTITGCTGGGSCTGVTCGTGARCVIQNAGTLAGSVGAGAQNALGVGCSANGCASITGTRIRGGSLNGGSNCTGLQLTSTNTRVDDDEISTCLNPTLTSVSTTLVAIGLGIGGAGNGATITNCVIHDESLGGPTVTAPRQRLVAYDVFAAGAPAVRPVFVNNTVEYCSPGVLFCDRRVGIAFTASLTSPPGANGIFRNNVIGARSGGTAVNRPVWEFYTTSDPFAFTHNVLFDSAAASLYYDEGSTERPLITDVNALGNAMSTYTSNLSVDCALDATWHLPAASMCIDVGTATDAPRTDFDAESRPLGAGIDVGADER